MRPPEATVRAPFVVIPQFFGCAVFDRSTSRYLPFDAETTDLLVRSRNVPFLTLASELTDPEKRDQAEIFYSHFYDVGFFDLDGRFTGAVLDVELAHDHLTGPLAVHLEVVAACNLTCSHCFAGALPRKEKPLTFNELEELFADMAAMGSFRLGLTGGEPLLRRDIFDVLDLATNYGLHPCLTTNGLLITEEIAREFGKRELIWLNVSLEGATAVTNDRIHGEGVFDKVLRNLNLLAKHSRFTLAFTIMRTNAAEVKECADLAFRVGATTAVFRPLYPVGTAERHLNELMPTFAQYDAALGSLMEMADGEARVIDPFSPRLRADTQANTRRNYGCGAGNSVCSVSVSGDVNPCSFLGASFVAANVRERSLSSIWRESETFRGIRALPGGDRGNFSGGCRARALTLNGSANATDPWMDEAQHMRLAPITFRTPSAIVEFAGADPGGAS